MNSVEYMNINKRGAEPVSLRRSPARALLFNPLATLGHSLCVAPASSNVKVDSSLSAIGRYHLRKAKQRLRSRMLLKEAAGRTENVFIHSLLSRKLPGAQADRRTGSRQPREETQNAV